MKSPVIKWMGGKLWCNDILQMYFPKSIGTIYDPFCGGGGMFPAYSRTGANVCAGDIISPLIKLWIAIKYSPDTISNDYALMWSEQKRLGNDYYYFIRDRFNTEKRPSDFMFLNRLCMNGMTRFNSNGEFNVSYHHNRDGIKPNKLAVILSSWSEAIRNTTFVHSDYTDTLLTVRLGDFVFLDPPYPTIGDIYSKSNAVVNDQYLSMLERFNSIGVNWMMTYSTVNDETSSVLRKLSKAFFPIGTGQPHFLNAKHYKGDSNPRDYSNMVYTNYNLSINLPNPTVGRASKLATGVV